MARNNPAAKSAGAGISQLPDSFWRSLRFFSIYRLIVAGVFFVAAALYGGTPNLGSLDIQMFRSVGAGYLIAAIGFLGGVHVVRRAFNVQLTVQVAADVLALTLLMYASGGAKSGIGVMIFVVLAGAGLVGQGRMTLFYAALATLALMVEQTYHVIRAEDNLGGFFRTGLTCIGFFGTAIVARLLGRRVVTNEALAHQRGAELANQLRINERVIRDMQDGVLVVDADRRVRQHNPQAEAMLDICPTAGDDLAAYSAALAEQFDRWSAQPVETEKLIRVAGSLRFLRARLLPPGECESALIYLEDMGRIQAQAQQMKLAALGRLTANMAHEIRNPLSAISQAAELLVDEPAGDGHARLIRIIGDNTQRLNRLVEQVLVLGRRDRAQPEPIHIATYLRQFLDEFAFKDPGVGERVASTADTEAIVIFDRAHLHRVLWNLISNALRYCSGAPGVVRVSAVRESGRVELHIVDDGAGIGESLRGQVFEPFFTTHGSGTGLGLYIARELCEANGAQIDLLDNSPGAHFRIVAKGEA